MSGRFQNPNRTKVLILGTRYDNCVAYKTFLKVSLKKALQELLTLREQLSSQRSFGEVLVTYCFTFLYCICIRLMSSNSKYQSYQFDIFYLYGGHFAKHAQLP